MLVKDVKIPIKELILFGFLPAALKKAIYRRRGYKIAASAKLGIGAVVVGKDVSIGEEVKIGMLTFIVGRRIEIAPRVQIGMMTFIVTYDFAVGEGTRINNQVVIGGMATPRSSFKMGANGILMEWSFINTTEPVVIGNNVGIGGHCRFFTHGMWPNAFEGYPYKYAPIHIEDDAWLAWGVSVLPGAAIGRGTIVSSDACVTGRLPEGALAGGVPARVISSDYSYKRSMNVEARAAMLSELLAEYIEWLRFHGFDVVDETLGRDRMLRITKDAERANLIVWNNANASTPAISNAVVVSVEPIDHKTRQALFAGGLPWLDLAKCERSKRHSDLADDIEEFLRRRGLRVIKYGPWQS